MPDRAPLYNKEKLKKFADNLSAVQHRAYPQNCIVEGYLATSVDDWRWDFEEHYQLLLSLEEEAKEYKVGFYFHPSVEEYLIKRDIRLTNVKLDDDGCVFIKCRNCYFVL